MPRFSSGVHDFSGLVPRDIIRWATSFIERFLDHRGWRIPRKVWHRLRRRCPSGHAIAGLTELQFPSLIAVVGFFAGSWAATYWTLPLLVSASMPSPATQSPLESRQARDDSTPGLFVLGIAFGVTLMKSEVVSWPGFRRCFVFRPFACPASSLSPLAVATTTLALIRWVRRHDHRTSAQIVVFDATTARPRVSLRDQQQHLRRRVRRSTRACSGPLLRFFFSGGPRCLIRHHPRGARRHMDVLRCLRSRLPD